MANKYLPNGMTMAQCKFANRADMVEFFSDPRYKSDPEFREMCGVMTNNGYIEDEGKPVPQVVSGRTLARAMSDPDGARKQEMDLVNRELYMKMFLQRDENGDLLYEKSAVHRESVRQFLIDNNDAIDAAMPAGTLVNRDSPNGRKAFRVEIGRNHDEAAEIRQGIKDKETAQDAADLKAKHDMLDRGEPTDHYDLGGKKV